VEYIGGIGLRKAFVRDLLPTWDLLGHGARRRRVQRGAMGRRRVKSRVAVVEGAPQGCR
jgi:hypothetical protein